MLTTPFCFPRTGAKAHVCGLSLAYRFRLAFLFFFMFTSSLLALRSAGTEPAIGWRVCVSTGALLVPMGQSGRSTGKVSPVG